MKYSALVALLLGVGTVSAGVFPTVPDGSAIFTPNQQVTIQWKDDGKAPSLGKMGTIQVDFMTGADLQQTTLDPLGTPEAASGKLAWVVPQVEPAGKYYFLKFTSVSNNELVYFTTRFTITDTNGKYPPEDDPPPAVGKNLGKVGKIIAKGDPDGPVPKTVGEDPSLNDPGTPEPTGTPNPTGTSGTAGTPEPSGTPEPTGTQTTGTPETPEAPETSETPETPDTPEYPGAKGNGQVKESDSKDTNAPTDTSSAFDASKTGSNMANDAGSINNQIYGGLIGLTLVCSLFSIFF